MTREQIRRAALQLNATDRETLAEELLRSIGRAECESIDAAWIAEARSRDEAFRSCNTTPLSVGEVIASIKRHAGS